MQVSEFERLLSAAKAGDQDAFGLLFRGVQPLLLRYLGALGGSLAEDCAAETWLHVIRGMGRFAGDEPGFRAWVFTIGRRRMVDELRRRSRREVLCDDPHGFRGDTSDVTSDPAVTFEERQDTVGAVDLLARLPVEQREAIFLRHVAGLDVRQAADVLGRSAGSVRVATHRGLRRLGAMVREARAGGCVTPGPGVAHRVEPVTDSHPAPM
jgi:RNA polymerase sigma-70 factor, ECF subfamily